LDQLTYNSYGNILTETNVANGDRFNYTSREWNGEIGLQYNRARYYSPMEGRWVNQDASTFTASDSNLYRYALNKPENGNDPTGYELYCYQPAPSIHFKVVYKQFWELDPGLDSVSEGDWGTNGHWAKVRVFNPGYLNACNSLSGSYPYNTAGALIVYGEHYPPGLYRITVNLQVQIGRSRGLIGMNGPFGSKVNYSPTVGFKTPGALTGDGVWTDIRMTDPTASYQTFRAPNVVIVENLGRFDNVIISDPSISFGKVGEWAEVITYIQVLSVKMITPATGSPAAGN
jgi:RHS repeat-associated protein